jgi:membrane protein DedA with SNARE-associated domain
MGPSLTHLIVHYGYFAIFALIMVEDFGVPAPGETALVAASAAAASGTLNIWIVVAVAVTGAILGDNIGYAIGRFGGQRLVIRAGRRIGLDSTRFAEAQKAFERYGDAIVVGARFVEVLRQLNGIVAGTMGMPWSTFLRLNALGALLWVGAWASIGYFAGHNIKAIESVFVRFHSLALAAVAVAGIAYLLVRHSASKRMAAADEAASRDQDAPVD